VVVRKWEKRVSQTGGTVYFTNGEMRDPFVVFDTYDWRSVISELFWSTWKTIAWWTSCLTVGRKLPPSGCANNLI